MFLLFPEDLPWVMYLRHALLGDILMCQTGFFTVVIEVLVTVWQLGGHT